MLTVKLNLTIKLKTEKNTNLNILNLKINTKIFIKNQTKK